MRPSLSWRLKKTTDPEATIDSEAEDLADETTEDAEVLQKISLPKRIGELYRRNSPPVHFDEEEGTHASAVAEEDDPGVVVET